MIGISPLRALTAVLFATAISTLTSCSINPATGTPHLVLMSETKELSIGEELHKKLLEKTPIYPDKTLQAYIDKVGQTLVKNSHRNDIKYTFTIIDNPDINAFALPGGYIYINRGLLGYLHSEAQLAAVLAHEIAHVTARHAVRQDAARKGSSVLSVASTIVTGSGVVGDVTKMWSTAAVMGYGREMELEADSIGAQYLNNSNYDPKAMIDVVGILKDQEKFSRRLARESGKKTSSYHGVFSTHPRNDKRLQEAISQAEETERKSHYTNGEEVYRSKTEGLIFGINYDVKVAIKNTFRHKRLAFEIDFPKDWGATNQQKQIIAKPKDSSAQLTLNIDVLKQKWAPDIYINKNLKIRKLGQSEAIRPNGLLGHTGIIEATETTAEQRIAVIYKGRLIFTLRGNASTGELTDELDELLLTSIKSFRPAHPVLTRPGKSKTIHYVKANDATTYTRLAQHMKLDKNGEQLLRLINGHYPRIEPIPGQWIKVIR